MQEAASVQPGKWKLTHNRPECIGCGACAAIAPTFWVMAEDGKSDIIDSHKRDDGWEEIEIEDKDEEINREAAESCPVNVIHLTDTEGKQTI
ncbi:ferredoxin [Candidatus Woesearchaeota archaeon]|nr:ferredoxin [Candidatus Woesearchaeota archaeon]